MRKIVNIEKVGRSVYHVIWVEGKKKEVEKYYSFESFYNDIERCGEMYIISRLVPREVRELFPNIKEVV